MTATASTNTSQSDSIHLVTDLVARERRILELKSQRRNCLQIQLELGINSTDKSAIKHLRQIYFGEKIGSLPLWTVDRDHQPAKMSPENAMHVVKTMGYKARFNLLKDQVFLNGKPVEDNVLSLIQNEAKRWGLNASSEHLDAVIKEMALNDKYHPFKEWVELKPWDGHDYFADLCATLTINPNFGEFKDLYQTDLHHWLLGLIAKQYGVADQNIVLVLQGDQNKGKDKWFRKLIPLDGCYSEGGIDPNNKDHKFFHKNRILYNASEIDATIRRKDASALKQFLTLAEIDERQPYGKYPVHFKSTCSFCGSVNDPQFLNDPTGSRRFRIIPIESVDYKHSVDVQQVFAQALHLVRQAEKYWYDENETDSINDANAAFCLEDKVDVIASKIEPGDTALTCTEILELYGLDRDHSGDKKKLGIKLTKMGLESKNIKVKGISLKHYYIKTPTQQILDLTGAKKSPPK